MYGFFYCMRRRNLGDSDSREKIKQLLKQTNPGWMQTRLSALRMGFNPDNSNEFIAESLGVNVSSVKRWFSIYRSGGLDAVLNRDHGTGRPTQLDGAIKDFLQRGLENARWNTAQQACEDLQSHFKCSFNYKTVWVWLKKCAGVLRIPRPVHEKRNPAKAESFKRNFNAILHRLPISKGKPVKVWFADESRYGLLPNLRSVWTLKGKRPHKRWQSRYEWSYCYSYGAIDPISGDTVFVQTPSVSMEWTEAFLEQIKIQYPNHEHIVVWDGAGFHPKESSHEKVPDGVHIVCLPPYSIVPSSTQPDRKTLGFNSRSYSKQAMAFDRAIRPSRCFASERLVGSPRAQRVISLFGDGWIRSSVNDS